MNAAPDGIFELSGYSRPYDMETGLFYDQLIAPGTFGVVAAVSGKGKTLTVCNIAAHAAIQGKRVGIVCLDMPRGDIMRRIATIVPDLGADAVNDVVRVQGKPGVASSNNKANIAFIDATRDVIARINYIDLTHIRCAETDVRGELIRLSIISDVLILDGLEAVAMEHGWAASITAILVELRQLADTRKIAAWTTSQCKRDAENAEITQLGDLAITIEKAHKPSIVISMAPRLDGRLWTFCISKDRHYQLSTVRAVYRLVLRPSLRFEILPTQGGLDISTLGADAGGEWEFEGLQDDLPGEYRDGDESDDAGAEVYLPTLPLYHGTTGFIPLGRGVFCSAMFGNRDHRNFHRLMDLYQMAQFVPTKLHAPGTRIPVHLARGQVLTSLRILRARWNDKSHKSIRTFLAHAAEEELITMEDVFADGTRVCGQNHRRAHAWAQVGE
ncbi:MAG: hypothetical protein O2901_11585 [Verrucomicrobia bacterium]|nr:hypothetical protein [Verrucomicrobiota bacterium]